MATLLKQNFEQFCRDYEMALEQEQNNPDADATELAGTKKPEYELYQKLANVNGKKGDEVISALLSSVFDEDTRKIEQHLTRYFDILLKD